MTNQSIQLQRSRRVVLKNGVLFLSAVALGSRFAPGQDDAEGVRIGLITDLHYADKAPAGTRHYRETLAKLEEAGRKFEEESPDFLVELGDFIDAADSVEVEQRYLKAINQPFAELCDERHYVLGNHCVDTLTKEEFLDGVEQASSYYSFDRNGFHFIVLDACFRGDGEPYGRKNFEWTDPNISEAEMEWLQADLNENDLSVVVFAHQRLDVSNNYGVKNNAKVREILEASGQVLAVFQGHSHQNDLKEIGGIHYCTLAAMVEGSGEDNNGYSLMDIKSNGTIELTGYRRQSSYNWQQTS